MSDNVKESYLQCQNIYCSATFKTHESICAVIRSPVTEENQHRQSTAPAVVRKVKGCYSSPFKPLIRRRGVTTMSLQQAFEVCQNNKAAWLQRKMSWQRLNRNICGLLSGEGRNVSRPDELRNIIEVRKWQVNQAAGRYICSHEAVQHISIRERLNDFMQQHGTALAAAIGTGADGLQ